MKVRFTPRARRELLLAFGYLAERNPAAALRVRARIETALRRVERFPAIGRPLPEFPGHPHREVLVRPYRVVYRLAGRTIWIVAVWHTARRPKRSADPGG